jgi:alkylation response protein AidB-like acyl-CoA dehydrogenase
MRASSLEQAGTSIGAEASILKIRGSEIQQELSQLLMECAGPYAIPHLPEALNAEFAGETADGHGLNALAAQYLDLRKVSIYGGTNEVQKNLIARALLGSQP